MINCNEAITYDAMLAASESYAISACDFSSLIK
jgi:hypothetical protein